MATVRVKGLSELNRDFKKMDRDLSKELRKSLKEAAEPVKDAAQELALTRIGNMPRSPDWAGQRVGATARSVYIVPKRRRRGGSPRPNLANLLLEQAMEPALEEKSDEVAGRVDRMLGELGDDNGF